MNEQKLTDERRAELIAILKNLQRGIDPEEDHVRADDVLCDALTELGYEDIVAEWSEVFKWYA